MTSLAAATPLIRAVVRLLGPEAFFEPPSAEVLLSPLPSSRTVLQLTFPEGRFAVVGKFYSAYPPATPTDLGLAREYNNYVNSPALRETNGSRLIPRLLGQLPGVSLGLLLETVPGPDLDTMMLQAALYNESASLRRALEQLAQLLARFHSQPVPVAPLSALPALAYLDKLVLQLQNLDLLTPADTHSLLDERAFWESRLATIPDWQVLVHGDATPTNFLFPDGRAVALDLERMRIGDRLWDLSWVAGELKHAWGWRAQNPAGAEEAISHFLQAYLEALPAEPALARRIYCLNPFYMALAELRIARNLYLNWDYRRELVLEARRCLAAGRRL